MASNLRPHAVVFIIIGVFFLASAVNSIPTDELESMLDTLRIRGYELFGNAIVTSDLSFELLSDQNNTRIPRSYTFFAPIDSSLFALDMTLTASSYVDTLRFHIVPRRLSIANLLRLPTGTSLPTLLFRRQLNVTQSPGSVSVGGVNVAFPGLFYGRHVAVHGLNGIISLRSSAVTRAVSGSPVGFLDRWSSFPRSGSSSSESHSVTAPSPTARPPGENLPPVNRKTPAPALDPTDANSLLHAASPFHQAAYPPEQSNLPDNSMIHAPDNNPSLAASPFNPAVHPPEPDEPDSLDNLMIHAPDVSPSLAASPFNPAVHTPAPDESNSLDNPMMHAPENSHSDADLLLNRAVDPPESDEPYSMDDIMILAPEDSLSDSASPLNQVVHPPEPDEPNSLDNIMIRDPEDSQVSDAWQFNRAFLPTEPNIESSSLDNLMIHAPEVSHSPASTTESPANVYVVPPVVSHALTPHSSISAPPLEYSDAAVPTAMSPDMWLPNKRRVALIETFKSDSEGPIKMGHDADEVQKILQSLIGDQHMPEKYKPLDGAAHCVDPDVGLGLHQCTTCRDVCE